MQMTPAEIAAEYRQAKVPSKQIGILADLNCCTKKEIVEILRAEGEKVQGWYDRKPKETGAATPTVSSGSGDPSLTHPRDAACGGTETAERVSTTRETKDGRSMTAPTGTEGGGPVPGIVDSALLVTLSNINRRLGWLSGVVEGIGAGSCVLEENVAAAMTRAVGEIAAALDGITPALVSKKENPTR